MLLSWSRLSTFGQCAKKYHLSYHTQVPKIPQGGFLGGAAVHKSIQIAEGEDWWRDTQNAKATFEEETGKLKEAGLLAQTFLNTFDALVIDSGGPDAIRWSRGGKQDYRWWRFNGPLMLRRYCAVRQADEEQGIILTDIEAKVLVPLTEDLSVQGYIDGVGARDRDTGMLLFIRDWKISGGDAFQLAVYATFYEHVHGTPVEHGQLVRLNINDPDRRILDFNLTKWTPLVVDKFLSLARSLRSETEWTWNHSSFCISCPVRMSCPYGATLDEKVADD